MTKRKKGEGEIVVHLGEGGENLIKLAKAIGDGAKSAAAKVRRRFSAYAAPNMWGPTVPVASHIGSVRYTIQYSAIGETLVLARVTYWKGEGGGQRVREEFRDQTTITTSNSVGSVECEFTGIPLGSAVSVEVNP